MPELLKDNLMFSRESAFGVDTERRHITCSGVLSVCIEISTWQIAPGSTQIGLCHRPSLWKVMLGVNPERRLVGGDGLAQIRLLIFARYSLPGIAQVAYPYLVLDARYEKVREDGAVRSQAVLVAIGINWEGKRSVLVVELASREVSPVGANC
jgi:hypothetical protein